MVQIGKLLKATEPSGEMLTFAPAYLQILAKWSPSLRVGGAIPGRSWGLAREFKEAGTAAGAASTSRSAHAE